MIPELSLFLYDFTHIYDYSITNQYAFFYNIVIFNIFNTANLQANYSSWEEQNMDEAKALVDDISGSEIVVVMGDLNCGPVIPEGGPGEFSGASAYKWHILDSSMY